MSDVLALAVDANGEVAEVGLGLKDLQTAVGGLIQPIDIADDLTMWVNEEFLLFSEPQPNFVASGFFTFVGGTYNIHGTVVFTGGTDAEGKTLPLSADNASAIHRIVDTQNRVSQWLGVNA
jgi:hypothetical protein